MAEQNIDELRAAVIGFIDRALLELEKPEGANLLDLQSRIEKFFKGAYLDKYWDNLLQAERIPHPWSIYNTEYQELLKKYLHTIRAQYLSGTQNAALEQIKPNTISPDILKEQIRALDESKKAKQAYETKWKDWYEQTVKRFLQAIPEELRTQIPTETQHGAVSVITREWKSATKQAVGENRSATRVVDRHQVLLEQFAVSMGLSKNQVNNRVFMQALMILDGMPQEIGLLVPDQANISRTADFAGVFGSELSDKTLPKELEAVPLSTEKRAKIGEYLASTLIDAGFSHGTDGQLTPEFVSQIENALALLAGSPLSPVQKAKLLAWAWDNTLTRKYLGLPDSKQLLNLLTLPSRSMVTGLKSAVPVPVLTNVRSFFLGFPGSIGGFFGGVINGFFALFSGPQAASAGSALGSGVNGLLSNLFSFGGSLPGRQRQLGLATTVLKAGAETFLGKYKWYIAIGAILVVFLFTSGFTINSAALLPPTITDLPGGPGSGPGGTVSVYDGPLGPVDILGCPANNGYAVCQVPYSSYSHSEVNAFDIAVPTGEAIYATHDGYVVDFEIGFAENEKNCAYGYRYGNYVILVRRENNDPNGRAIDYTWYGHLLDVVPEVLESGRLFRAGDPIGRADNNGCSTGDHLHYEHRDANNIPDHTVFLDLDQCEYTVVRC